MGRQQGSLRQDDRDGGGGAEGDWGSLLPKEGAKYMEGPGLRSW